MSNETFDLVVLGAGTAGCLAAFTAAKRGIRKIALIDRKPKKLIGKKICGDGIGTKHLEFLEELGFPIKEKNVISNLIKTAHLVSPNKEKDFTIPTQDKLTIINRYNLGQVLLEEVIKTGVKLFDNTTFKEINLRQNKAFVTLNNNSGNNFSISAPLVIDGSGINSKIREDSNLFGKYAQIKDDEQYYCYREICKFKNLPDYHIDSTVFEFGFESTRGGYMWFFSRGKNEMNMGTGIPKSWIKEVSPKSVYENYMINRFKDYKVIDNGGGFVPTRHPIPSHVKDNIILIGDAGCIVNPLHGGGLSASIHSGYIAGKIAAELIPNEAIKEEDLWVFNQKIMERYGKRYSLLDLYRILLQNIPDNELNNAFMEEYLPLGMIFYAREYELLLNLSQQLSEYWSQIDIPRFNLLPKAIEQVNTITNEYPTTPYEIDKWAEKYTEIYDTYQAKIIYPK